MHYITRLIFILILFCSCKGQDPFVEKRLKTVDKFLECLQNNTPDKILEYTYPGVDHNIDNKELRDFHINKAYRLITKFGLPPKDKWVIKYDPKNNFDRLLITIPLFKGNDTSLNLLQADIIIAFPPGQISDKIYRYEIADKYTLGRPIEAPPDSTPSITESHKSFTNKKQLLGIWESENKEPLTIKISDDSIYYTEHFASYKYQLKADSIFIYYPEFIYAGKLYFHKDTLIMESEVGKSKYVKFKK
ncbi:MAG: hypothetical protein ACHQ1D_09500 [Nitrososphaerales archaeon]